ncbi:putative nucleotidyltransferase, Ribonuclease H [Helianthus annuus]|nr:putative nucleotidyltransferase, Ribonuclease H [Helianthus annuus]
MPPRRENPTMEESIAALAEALSSSSKENSLKIDALTTQIAAQAEQTTLLIAALTKTDSKPSSSKPPLPENNLEIRPPKLILSTFDGTNPLDWLFQAEQYFAFYKTDPSQRLTIASFSMSGEALSWYIYLHNNKLLTTWDEFTRMLEIRFGPSSYENHQAALFKLCQTSTVTAYITEFERLSNCVVGLPPDALLNCFLSGLRKDIQKELAIHKPQSLAQAVGLAKLVDDKLGDIQYRPKLNPPFRATPTVSLPPIPPTTTPKPSTTNTSTPPILPTPTITNQTLPFNRLSHEALQQRKAAGLCFRCPEKYHRGHRCNPPQFHLIVDNDEPYEPPPLIDFSEDQLPQTEQPTQSQSDTIIHKQFLSLSPAALLGVASPKALRVTGLIAGHSVSILIDSGSTHNIVQPRVASFLNLLVNPIQPFSVMIGNGELISCAGFCPEVTLILAKHPFHIPLFVLPIEGADIVLGMAWLSSLGKIMADFSVPSISFTHQGNSITLTGEPISSPASSTNIHHLLHKDAIASMHTLIFQHEPDTPTLITPPHPNPNIQTLLQTFSHVFQTPSILPPPRQHDHHIHLHPNSQPVNVRPYRYPYYQKEIMSNLIKDMLSEGIIKPSTSPYSSPVLLVRKKDGTWRFCVDYRALNALTIRDRFPIPTVDELLDELHGAKIFSKLDLRAGYHQIRVAPEDTQKTAFRTTDGHYEFLVMPFGLSNAPSTFQAAMNDIFSDVLRRFVLVFFDDILVYSKSESEHVAHLHQVFQTLATHQFYAKLSKCVFGVAEINYLGHVISQLGVSTDTEKIVAIQKWPTPTSQTTLRGFLGLTGYYRRFVKSYSHIAGPLTDLLKGNQKFLWSAAAQVAFEKLKQAMVKLPTLTLPNFTFVFDVTTDASDYGIGAVLSQQDKPIAFFSKKLSPKMKAASAYIRELYAITEAIKKWRHYLLGRRFRVFTDQRSLRHLLTQVIQTPEQHKWASKLIGYDFEIYYKPGKENHVADALSRVTDPQLLTLSAPYFPWLHELRDYYTTTKEGRDMIRQIAESPDQHPNQQLHDGLIYRDAKLFIPIIPSLRLKLLHEFHSSKVGGHSDEVTQYINNCKVCQQTKYSTQKPYGLLQPLPIPNQVWEEISMDFITNLPPSNGKTAIWVIVDRLTKFAHFISLRPNYTATSLATIFLDQIYKLHGLPKSILSDRDPVFVSKFWKELFNSVGTTLLHSSAYHPQTDGQTEVVNRTLESYLRCFACDEPNRWTKYLYLAEFWYNTSHHSAIDMTPFQALYGRPPPSLPHYTLDKNRATTIEETLLEHQRVLDLLKSTLQITRQRMADQANKHRQDKEFSAGDLVLLRLRMYRQQSVAYRGVEKLSRRYYGPFMIIERIGKVAYRLALPPGSRIHPVFHVSLLRACKGDWQSEFTPLPPDFIATVQLDDGSGLEGKAVFEGRDNVTTHVSDTGPTMQSRPKRVISKPIRFLN